jgi:hypothetical protein
MAFMREEISGPYFRKNVEISREISKPFFDLAIRRFESCQVSQPVRDLENFFLKR